MMMTTLEQITLAASWGWSATLVHKKVVKNVVSILQETSESFGILLDTGENPTHWEINNLMEIAGWKYAGQLLGSKPIPEGQKFRRKSNGDIYKFKCEVFTAGTVKSDMAHVSGSHNESGRFYKSDLEPVF